MVSSTSSRESTLASLCCVSPCTSHSPRWVVRYCLVGHSGGSAEVPLVEFGMPPATPAERLDVIHNMYGHSRSCPSGDNSMEAARLSVADVVREEGDDYFVFLLSDANLGRYNVTPEELGAVLRADSRVNAYAIFVAEQNAAEWLAKELPFGHGFVCLDTSKLPTTFKDILAHASNTAEQ